MKARTFVLVVSCAGVAVSMTATAQVVIRGTESADQTSSSLRVGITTPDREIVPLLKDTKTTQENKGTQRTESVTRVRLNDGSYYDWQRTTTVKKEVAPGVTEISRDVVEQDRQGGDRTAQRTVETAVKTGTGEKSETKAYTRNSSGQLVLDRVIDATTVKEPGGKANTTRVEQVPDVNGNLVVKKQSEEVTTEQGPNATVTTARTRSANHLTGQLDVTEESTTSTRTDGAAKQIETVVRKPGRTGWEVTGRTTTTETTAPDGSASRETIEQGRSLYSTYTGNQMLEPLVPQRKIVERETRQANGAVVVQRDAFRRDVNGDWKSETFSTNQPSAGIGRRPPDVVPMEGQAAPESSEPVSPPPQPH